MAAAALVDERQKLAEDSFDYARRVATAYARSSRFDVDEAVSSAMQALVVASREWDPERYGWRPFLNMRIRYAIVDDERRRRGRVFRAPLASLDEDGFQEIADTAMGAETLAIAREDLAEAKEKAEAAAALTPKDKLRIQRERALRPRERPTDAALATLAGLAETGLRTDSYAAHVSRSPDTMKSHLKALRCAYELQGKSLLHVYAVALRRGHLGLPPDPSVEVKLTAREREVLRLIGELGERQRVADELGVTVFTVKFHLLNAREKLDACNTMQAYARALRLGLI